MLLQQTSDAAIPQPATPDCMPPMNKSRHLGCVVSTLLSGISPKIAEAVNFELPRAPNTFQ